MAKKTIPTNTEDRITLKAALEMVNDNFDEVYDFNVGNPYDAFKALHTQWLADLATKFSKQTDDFDFVFGYITDNHYIDDSVAGGKFPHLSSYNYLNCRNAADSADLQQMDLLVHGGDYSYDYNDTDNLRRCLIENVRELRKANCPIALVQGNHDTGDQWGNKIMSRMITPEEWGGLMTTEDDGRVYGDYSRSYYYKDFEDKGIRVIVLNTHDSWIPISEIRVKYSRTTTAALKQEQIEWFANEALNFTGKEGYHYIIIGHQHLEVTMKRPGKSNPPINADIIQGILIARREKTSYTGVGTTEDFEVNMSVDYTGSNTAVMIAALNGHTHLDKMEVVNGMQFISTRCSLGLGSATTGEDAWDLFCIDKTARKAKVLRFGVIGVDREFNY